MRGSRVSTSASPVRTSPTRCGHGFDGRATADTASRPSRGLHAAVFDSADFLGDGRPALVIARRQFDDAGRHLRSGGRFTDRICWADIGPNGEITHHFAYLMLMRLSHSLIPKPDDTASISFLMSCPSNSFLNFRRIINGTIYGLVPNSRYIRLHFIVGVNAEGNDITFSQFSSTPTAPGMRTPPSSPAVPFLATGQRPQKLSDHKELLAALCRPARIFPKKNLSHSITSVLLPSLKNFPCLRN